MVTTSLWSMTNQTKGERDLMYREGDGSLMTLPPSMERRQQKEEEIEDDLFTIHSVDDTATTHVVSSRLVLSLSMRIFYKVVGMDQRY